MASLRTVFACRAVFCLGLFDAVRAAGLSRVSWTRSVHAWTHASPLRATAATHQSRPLCSAASYDLAAVLRDVSAGNAQLIDVRENDEWDAGHLKLAKLVPLSTLGGALPSTIVPGKRVYLHCKAGVRAAKAAAALKQMGCADVVPLAEGYSALLSSGFPGA